MADESPKEPYHPPEGASSEHQISIQSREVRYRAVADFIVLRERDEPVAELFYSAYFAETDGASERPLVFLFNGGPGASSAYLHVGAVAPRRVVFGPRGEMPPPPVRLTDNEETWLSFADLVFVDPVGTGFSWTVEQKKKGEGAKASGDDEKNESYFALSKDLDSLGELMTRFLSKHQRWDSPIFIAGESYGGFRVGKLARSLQERFGIGLNGAILISPALELSWLMPTDYDVIPFVDTFPTMAAVAHHHGRASALSAQASLEEVVAAAETFATTELASLLLRGPGLAPDVHDRVLTKAAAFIGLDRALVEAMQGRVPKERFSRELLRDQGRVVGLYDGTVTGRDPFPDRVGGEGPDPTLWGLGRLFASGINAHLRRDLGVTTERQYELLSLDVNQAWKVDTQSHAFDMNASATDDLRYAMSLNPSMRVFITHGRFDLVTPYFTSNRLADLMKLDAPSRARVLLKHFHGGHMFYAWESSRRDFTEEVRAFVEGAIGSEDV